MVEITHGLHDDWELLDPSAPLPATAASLRAAEGRVPGEQLTFLIRENGSPVAGLYGTVTTNVKPYEMFNLHQVVTGTDSIFPWSDESRRERAALGAGRIPASWEPSLIVMYPSYACLPVGPAAEVEIYVESLVAAAVDWARDAGMRSVAFLYVSAQPNLLSAVLRRTEFYRIPLSYNSILGITGSTFDDYLRALPAKRRRMIRWERRQLESSEITFSLRPLPDCLDDVVRLRCALVRKYRGEVDDQSERQRLLHITKLLSDFEVGVFCAEYRHEVLGFSLFHGHQGVWYPYWTGTDYDHPRHRLVYFETLFYRPIQVAAASGVRAIEYGHGSWPVKRSRGCELVPLDGWVLPLDHELVEPTKTSARISRLVEYSPHA
jgi:hypothetical protein